MALIHKKWNFEYSSEVHSKLSESAEFWIARILSFVLRNAGGAAHAGSWAASPSRARQGRAYMYDHRGLLNCTDFKTFPKPVLGCTDADFCNERFPKDVFS